MSYWYWINFQLSSHLYPDITEKYVDPNKRISNDGGKASKGGVGGSKSGLLGLAAGLAGPNPFTVEARPSFKTLMEQAHHAIHRGEFGHALTYLNKAIAVS